MNFSTDEIQLRDVILGGQDGLVNVLGLSLGLFASHASTHIIIVAGLAAGFSEAVSMGAVAYTSSIADKERVAKYSSAELVFSSSIVTFSALFGSFIPILPFLFLPQALSIYLGLFFSAVILFMLGYTNAKNMGGNQIRGGLQIVVIGIVSALVGFVIGLLLKTQTTF